MKKIVAALLLITIGNLALAQVKTKREDIHKFALTKETLTALRTTGGAVDKVSISLTAQNQQYTAITDIITVYYGTPTEMYQFLKAVESFIANNKEGDVSTHIAGQLVSTISSAWGSGVYVWTKDGLGYRGFSIKMISKLIQKLLDWSKNNGIEIDTDADLYTFDSSSESIPSETSKQTTSKATELKALKELLDEGVLTQEEFEAEKQKILNQ
jgi:hypothetical protein